MRRTLCPTLLLLWSAPALALPGPEVLAPLAVGASQALAFGLALAATRPRLRSGTRLLLAVAIVSWVVIGLPAVVVGSLVTLTWLLRSRALAGVTLAVVLWAGLQPAVQPGRLAAGVGAPLPPWPEAPIPELRAGGRTVVHIGEEEDFLRARLRYGGRLRPADLDVSALPPGTVMVAADRLRLPGVFTAGDVLRGDQPGVVSWVPAGDPLWRVLTPRGIWRPRGQQLPGVTFQDLPLLRAIDGHTLVSVSATDLLAQPSAEFRAPAGRLRIHGADLVVLSAATRLARAAGAEVAAVSLSPPSPPPPAAPPWTAMLGLAMALGLAAEFGLRRALDRRFAARLQTGLSRPHTLELARAITPWGLGLCTAFALDSRPLPEALWPIAAPAAASPWPTAGPALMLLLGGALTLQHNASPQWLRPPLLAVGALATLFALPGVVMGPAPSPLHLALVAVTAVPALIAQRRPRGLRTATDPNRDGDKATRLQRLAARCDHVPPGHMLRTRADVAKAQARFGAGPLILRSSAPGEGAGGAHDSIRLTGGDARAAFSEVRQSQGDQGAVLAMPLIRAPLAGVARRTHLSVDVEGAAAPGAVTGGAAITHTGRLGLHSRTFQGAPELRAIADRVADLPPAGPILVEWVGAWIVQIEPLPLTEAQRLEGEGLGRSFGARPPADLERIGVDDLPETACDRTLALWAGLWRRDRALGHAVRALGLPARWLPDAPAVHLNGGLYLYAPDARRIRALLRLRAWAPGWNPAKRAAEAVKTPLETLEQVAAASIALRLIEGWLPDGPDRPTPTDPNAAHRAAYDLDPASPRFAAISASPPPLPPLPQTMDAPTCAAWRDRLHDRLAWHIGTLAAADPTWLTSPENPTAPPGDLRLTDLEGLHPATPNTHRAVWAYGTGPITGVLADTPGPDHILRLARADPRALQPGYRAVVAVTGGRLSHAALVARHLALPALFGAGPLPPLGTHVRLTEDGQVELT